MKLPKFPPEDFLKPPRLSQILKKANPAREVVEDAREGIKAAKEEISDIALALRVEGVEKPPETKQNEAEGKPSLQVGDLKTFLERRKVSRALSELEEDKGDKKKNLEIVRKYIEGEDID